MSADSESGPPVGSLAEESARLLGAFRDWASRGHEAANSFAAQANSADQENGPLESEHGPECAFCPICQGLSLLRGAKPEVAEHLAEALSSLVAAAAAMLPREEPAAPPRRARESAQHIDVSGDEPAPPPSPASPASSAG